MDVYASEGLRGAQMSRTVLVTGGAGYVGSHSCKALSQAGFFPIVFDNLSTGHRDLVRWGAFEKGDILDEAALDAVMAAHRPVAVLHFAALSIVEDAVREPERYHHNNVEGSQVLLRTMARHGVDVIVFSSTAAVYGLPCTLPIMEDAATYPITPYGATKLVIEDELSRSGFAWAALRYFNAAGADPESETGEHHEPETHLIPIVLDVAQGRRPAVHIFGEDYDTPDGTCVRDYVHVTDLADAHVRALESLLDGREVGILNLGAARGVSVREVIAAAGRVTGRPIPVESGPRRAGDPPMLVCSATAATAVLGWHSRRSIAVQIEDAWRWHRSRFG